jgi:adenylosuccinate synthase
VAVRYAARINGLDALALTKLDVLDGLESIEVCTGYRRAGQIVTDFPADLQLLADCEPVYESMPGWDQPTKGVRIFGDLPKAARDYVAKLEEVSGVPAAIISTGSDRDDTILREGSVLDRWFAGR